MNFVTLRNFARIAAVAVLLSAFASAPAFAAGALIIGKCGAYGQAIDYPRVEAAVAAARRKCKGKCPVVVTMKRQCAAYSIDMVHPCASFGYAVEPRISSALNAATRKCYAYGGTECVIRAWACDARG